MPPYTINTHPYKRMEYTLRQSIAARGVSAAWTPSASASGQTFSGILSPTTLNATQNRFGLDEDADSTFIATRTAFDEAEPFPVKGVLIVEGETYRVSSITVSMVSVQFHLIKAA